MSKKRREPLGPTKKQVHISKREQDQTRWLVIGTAIVAVLSVVVLGTGYVTEQVLKPREPVAEVKLDSGTEQITTEAYQERVRFERSRFIPIAYQIPQFAQQLANTEEFGGSVLDQMINETIVRAEAQKRGITVSADEIEREIERQYGFERFTPTPTATPLNSPTPTFTPSATATFTPSPTLTATVAITQTPTVTATPGPTNTPQATPTPLTEPGFNQLLDISLAEWGKYGVTRDDYRKVIEVQLLEQKVTDAIATEKAVQRDVEQVKLKLIGYTVELSATQAISGGALTPAQFDTLYAQVEAGGVLSVTTTTLDWSSVADLGTQYGDTLLNGVGKLTVGQIVTQPVSLRNSFYLVKIEGREVRTLSDDAFKQKKQDAFQEWIRLQVTERAKKFDTVWRPRTPSDPVGPPPQTNNQGIPGLP